MDRESISKTEPTTTIAVIFGASEFPNADSLPASPAFQGSARSFTNYLKSERGLRLADAQVLDLFDSGGNVIEQNDQLSEHLLRNQNASDLIIYYVGHGGFLPDREYFLALRSTKRGAEGITGLRIRALAHSLEENFPGKRVLLILDCCFAGEAVAQFQGSGLATIVENETFDALPAAGTSLLVAASKDEPAIAPMGAAYTMFSDCFLEVLEKGIVDGRKMLSLAEIGIVVQRLVRTKFGQRAVRPEIHSPRQGGGDVATFPLFPNPAYSPPKPAALPAAIEDALRNPLSDIRQGAIRPLAQFLNSDDRELARLARAELERLAADDDSRSVQQGAQDALGRQQEASEDNKPPRLAKRAPAQPRAERPQPKQAAPKRARLVVIASLAVLVLGAGLFWGFYDPGAHTDLVTQPMDEKSQQQRADVPHQLQAGRLDSPKADDALESSSAVRTNGEKNAEKAQHIAPAYTEAPRIPAPVEKARSATRVDDRILRLLTDARNDLQQDRLTTPEGNNAAERYRAVISIEPDNQAAREGLIRVVSRYVALANGALARQDFQKAEEYLAKAEGIAPANAELASARARIEKERATAEKRKVIERQLATAERDPQQGPLDSAKGSNALNRPAAPPSRIAFAVFPFQTLANCHYSVRDEVTEAADSVIRHQPGALLEYSYYEEGADPKLIPAVNELWSENVARRDPELDIVRKAGRELGVNGVLMAWYKCSQSQHVSADTYEVELYLIDINSDQVFHAKERLLDAKRAVSTVFEQFFTTYSGRL